MMNNFLKHLSSKKTLTSTSISLVNITKNISPIILTTLQLALMLTAMMITLPTFATEVSSSNKTANNASKASITDANSTNTFKSYSRGQIASSALNISKEELLKTLRQREILGESDQKLNKSFNTTRDAVMAKKYQQTSQSNKARKNLAKNRAAIANISNTSRSISHGGFVIYEGFSSLIEDYDGDSYYQTFSVTFDADLVTFNAHDEAVVYAELYLSENGGPWEHYYSTDSFVIHGESTDDIFEVYSTLAQGFSTNHYDVLIDLYEEGYPNIVASYSSDDSNSLHALPLESSDYDVEYVEYYEETYIHGGGTSAVFLIIIFIIFLMRYVERKHT
jgi:hypothetical protein